MSGGVDGRFLGLSLSLSLSRSDVLKMGGIKLILSSSFFSFSPVEFRLDGGRKRPNKMYIMMTLMSSSDLDANRVEEDVSHACDCTEDDRVSAGKRVVRASACLFIASCLCHFGGINERRDVSVPESSDNHIFLSYST